MKKIGKKQRRSVRTSLSGRKHKETVRATLRVGDAGKKKKRRSKRTAQVRD